MRSENQACNNLKSSVGRKELNQTLTGAYRTPKHTLEGEVYVREVRGRGVEQEERLGAEVRQVPRKTRQSEVLCFIL